MNKLTLILRKTGIVQRNKHGLSRLNPYNPLTYAYLICVYPIVFLIQVVALVISEIDFKNPFKY